MALDEKILSRVLADFSRRRRLRELERDERRDKIYAEIPRIAEIESELKLSSIDIIRSALRSGSNPAPMLGSISAHTAELRAEKRALLEEHGYPHNYLDVQYDCTLCSDTGYLPGGTCRCLVEACSVEQTRQLSRLLPIGDAAFDKFSLKLYSDIVDPKWGMSPRENMAAVLDQCREFAAYFGAGSMNLFLRGSTGLGKTYLSSCIAAELTRKGFSVVYDTAVALFALYEREKFSRDEDVSDEASAEIDRLYRCDLLILDDLGTEMSTPFIASAFYTLINTRLMNGQKMIINTNIEDDRELERRYGKPAISRLFGDFMTLSFFGEDIRIKKNMF